MMACMDTFLPPLDLPAPDTTLNLPRVGSASSVYSATLSPTTLSYSSSTVSDSSDIDMPMATMHDNIQLLQTTSMWPGITHAEVGYDFASSIQSDSTDDNDMFGPGSPIVSVSRPKEEEKYTTAQPLPHTGPWLQVDSVSFADSPAFSDVKRMQQAHSPVIPPPQLDDDSKARCSSPASVASSSAQCSSSGSDCDCDDDEDYVPPAERRRKNKSSYSAHKRTTKAQAQTSTRCTSTARAARRTNKARRQREVEYDHFREVDRQCPCKPNCHRRVFQCIQCEREGKEKLFHPHKTNMNTHLRVHKLGVTYPCEVCGVEFSSVSNLHHHERTSKKHKKKKLRARHTPY